MADEEPRTFATEDRTPELTAWRLPRHYDFSRFRSALNVTWVIAAVSLFLWNLIRCSSTLEVFQWWVPPTVVAGLVAADFASGMVHWTADTWGAESLPVLGRRFLHPFRVHHVNPDDFLRRRFFETNGDVAMFMLPILGVITWLGPTPWGSGAPAVFLLAFSVVALPTNQLHQWAHMKNPPRVVRMLQIRGVLLSREAHGRHHKAPYSDDYCIATGWCNRPLAAIEFFRRLERSVTWLTGLQPRQDDERFQEDLESLVLPESRRVGERDE